MNQNSNTNLNQNPAFHGTAVSNTGSQDSGIEVIETAHSRAPKRRMMARPPTSSGQPNDGHMTSINSQARPLTDPANRPPLHNPHQNSLATPGTGFNLAQDGVSEHMP